MIKKGNEHRKHAYFLQAELASSVTALYRGQIIMLDANGKMVICDGTKRGFMSWSEKNTTRDNVSDKGGMASYSVGPVVVTIDTEAFVTGQTYGFGVRLKSNNAGKLTPIEEGTDSDKLICAEALGAEANGELTVRML